MAGKRKIVVLCLSILSVMLFVISSFANNKTHTDVVNISSSAPSKAVLSSNRYTQRESDAVATNPYVTQDGYVAVEGNKNSNLQLLFDASDLSFRILDKRSGYLWGSNLELDYLDDPNSELWDEGDMGSNQVWKNKFKSPVLIQYYVGTVKREENLFESKGSSFKVEPLKEKAGFSATLKFAISKISLTMHVYLDETGLNIEIPFDQIKEEGTALLSNVIAYPFFGATKRMRTPGYVFIPDGIGALIRFNDQLKGVYSKRFFGPDYAVGGKQPEESLYANVYGMVHGSSQNAFLAILEKGAANATLVSYPSRETTDYNWTYVDFEYRVAYTQFLNQSQTSSVSRIQEKINPIDIHMKYQFLTAEDADYAGMANAYRDYLVATNVLTKNEPKSMIPLHLDVLAAENKKGILRRKTFSMTTIGQLEAIIADLGESGITNLNISYQGWADGGYSYHHSSYSSVSKVIGGSKAMERFLHNYGETIDFYLQTNYTTVHQNASGSNFNQVAQSIGTQLLSYRDHYLLKPAILYQTYTKNYQSLAKIGVAGISLEEIGTMLYSDYSKGVITRSEMVEVLQQYLTVAKKTSIPKAYSYLWAADSITDAPMYSSQQAKMNDTVPFMTMVLGGYTDVFARVGNFFSNTQNELLRMIDYRLYPSFYITNESSYLLLDTGSQHIYTSRYLDWKTEIARQYQYVNQALHHVSGVAVRSRTVLAPGVVVNTYENNVKVYINYTGENITVHGISMTPQSYEVIR